MKNKEIELTLDSELLAPLKADINKMLSRTIGNMTLKGTEDADITVKIHVSLDKMRIGDMDNYEDVTIPEFKHNISSVMTVKENMKGQSSERVILEFDSEKNAWVIRNYDNGQSSMFDDEDDYEPVTRSLPQHDEIEDEDDEEAEEVTAYSYLRKFIGQSMTVTESMGNYAVRTEDKKIVLTSATNPDNPFYCDADILKEHVGHELLCTVISDADYPDAEDVGIVCTDCDEEEPIFILQDDREYEYDEPES